MSKTFYGEDPNKKFKKEIMSLLKRPDRMKGASGVIITREEMARWRIGHVFDYMYKEIRNQYRSEAQEAKLTRRNFPKRSKMTLKDMVELGVNLLTPEEKADVYKAQQERLEKMEDEGIPDYLFLKEEQIDIPVSESDLTKLEDYFKMNAEEFIAKYPSVLSPPKKVKRERKPSARNLFMGEKMREGMSMKDASDLWKTLSSKEQEAYKP